MDIELILIILLGVLLFAAMGAALHLARTNERQRQYISELERDYSNVVSALQGSALLKQHRDHDSATDHQ